MCECSSSSFTSAVIVVVTAAYALKSYYTCDFAAIAVLVFDPNDAAAIAVAFVKVAASAAAYL